MNKSRHKLNQPPTGKGKKESKHSGEAHELEKRSEVMQAERGHPEENLGTAEEEMAFRSPDEPQRAKMGR